MKFKLQDGLLIPISPTFILNTLFLLLIGLKRSNLFVFAFRLCKRDLPDRRDF